jgi:hypothetical protein
MKYTAPVDPYLKFRSDLARELTAKQFPVWSYHKLDKKVYRSPASVLYTRSADDFIVLRALSNDQLAVRVDKFTFRKRRVI